MSLCLFSVSLVPSHLLRVPTKPNLYLPNSQAIILPVPDLYILFTFKILYLKSFFLSLCCVQLICLNHTLCNGLGFHDEKCLAARPSPKPEDRLLSADRHCIFSTFTATHTFHTQ